VALNPVLLAAMRDGALSAAGAAAPVALHGGYQMAFVRALRACSSAKPSSAASAANNAPQTQPRLRRQ